MESVVPINISSFIIYKDYISKLMRALISWICKKHHESYVKQYTTIYDDFPKANNDISNDVMTEFINIKSSNQYGVNMADLPISEWILRQAFF